MASNNNCGRCNRSSFIIQIATYFLAIAFGLTTFNVYTWIKLDDAKDDLEKIKNEYMEIIYVVKDFKDFSPEEFDSLGREVQKEAAEAMKIFRNIFIASAILSNTCEDKDERIEGWKIALRNNPDSRLCYYGLGMAYVKAAIEQNSKTKKDLLNDAKKEYEYLQGAIRYLSHPSIRDVSTALYHLGLAHLMLSKDVHSPKSNDKYYHAYEALEAINHVDKRKEKISDIDTNLGIAYCIMSRNINNKDKKAEYLDIARHYLNPLKDIPGLELIREHYNDCILYQ